MGPTLSDVLAELSDAQWTPLYGPMKRAAIAAVFSGHAEWFGTIGGQDFFRRAALQKDTDK